MPRCRLELKPGLRWGRGCGESAAVETTEAYRLVRLANGRWSIHSTAEEETFHPVIGPAAEAEALYVGQLRLRERLAAHDGEFVLWDVGLGAAANPLTALRAARGAGAPVRILSFDRTLGPLAFGLRHARELGYFDGYEAQLKELLEAGRTAFSNGGRAVVWETRLGDFPALLRADEAAQWPKPHAILFDAFSPARNPAMWTLPLFTRLFALLDPARPCAMPTYSRSTMLRTTLLLAGFFVGAGEATGEKEETTLAANTPALVARPLDRRWLARARRSTCAEPLREPVYRRARLSEATWDRLLAHPQFQEV